MSQQPAGLVALDLAGVFVFALSGGLAAVRARLDVFGVVVLATVTAIGGGVLRDTLLGATPPASFRHWPYLAVPAAAGVVVFYWHPQVARLRRLVLLADAAGLALCTVTGARQALDAGLGAGGSCALGVITGIGGGVIRDVLLREISARPASRDLCACRAVGRGIGLSRTWPRAARRRLADRRGVRRVRPAGHGAAPPLVGATPTSDARPGRRLSTR